ncbi:hypothetical protein MWU59_04695 [Flavobacteriaceae bacterium F08102]|nr:hypothetical protein [Flavobacteriaceae bacterium F08102]
MKVFIEEQRITSWWIHVILILSIGVPIFLIGQELYITEAKGGELIVGSAVLLLLMFGVYGLIISMRLRTRIDEVGVHFQYSPFHRNDRILSWQDVKTISVRKYSALIEYGGWGIRSRGLRSKRRGIAYTIRGNMGIQLLLKSGEKILIGTQKPQEAEKVLYTYQAKFTSHVH